MTGSWEAAVTAELSLNQIRQDHGAAEARMETLHRRQNGEAFHSVMWERGYRKGWWAAVAWVLEQQHRFDALDASEALAEIRKGPGSIYWPIKSGDPTFHADCPTCGHPTLIDTEGLCRDCGWELN